MNTPTPSTASKVSHVNGVENALHSVVSTYKNATQGLQNYGANIAARVSKGQADRALPGGKVDNYKSINPFPNPFNPSSYQRP